MAKLFRFLENPTTGSWVIISSKRSKRPGIKEAVTKKLCPFCPGDEKSEKEIFRIGSGQESDWEIRVVPNKFPFTDIHEIIIHSKDHHKNFEELSDEQNEKILFTYRERYRGLETRGQVYIFHNSGRSGGESLTHPHTQIAALPFNVTLRTPKILKITNLIKRTKLYNIFCPAVSEWPYEVWAAPLRRIKTFGEVNSEELRELAIILKKLLLRLSSRFGHGFSFNLYIYPFRDWYLRIIPRQKSLGGLEVGTGIMVVSVEPKSAKEFFQKIQF